MKVHPRFMLAAVLLTGCAPRIIGNDDNGESSSGETTADPSTTFDTLSTTDPSTTLDTLTTSETSTEETSTTEPNFVPDDDGWGGDPCDIFQQDCPEDEKCVPYSFEGDSWDSHKCVPLMGSQPPGEPCWYSGLMDATDNCDATSMCWDVDSEGNGTCTAFCTGTPDDPMCPPGSQCLISGDATIALCISDCDPLLQDCAQGFACFWYNDGFQCVFTTDGIPVGEPCGFINDCAAGNICLDAGLFPACMGASCCSMFCDTDLGPAPCEAVLPGTECVPFFDMPPPGSENVGVCILPQP